VGEDKAGDEEKAGDDAAKEKVEDVENAEAS
jgi:hypothetical protein